MIKRGQFSTEIPLPLGSTLICLAVTGSIQGFQTNPLAASKLLISFFIFHISTLRSALVSPSTPLDAIFLTLATKPWSVWREVLSRN